MLAHLTQVALGGAVGASARYALNVAFMRALGPGFPWATMAANVLGSFLMGALVVAMAKKGGQHLAPFLMTGVLGGFTTFSAFSLDVATLYERGQLAQAAGYAAASVVLSVGALFAAMWVLRVALA